MTNDKRSQRFINQTVNDGVAHSKNSRKCAYHVTFDLDLKHILDARSPGVHRVKVWWRSGHLPARRSDLRKSLQTDRRTDDGRLAIVLAHSRNELKIKVARNATRSFQNLDYRSTSAMSSGIKENTIVVLSWKTIDQCVAQRKTSGLAASRTLSSWNILLVLLHLRWYLTASCQVRSIGLAAHVRFDYVTVCGFPLIPGSGRYVG